MLGYWRPHSDYQPYLIEKITPIFLSDRPLVEQYEIALSKLYTLDLDPLKSVLQDHYSHTGAPAENQPELFRSFILMTELKIHSIPKWVDMLRSYRILSYMISEDLSETPGVGSMYDLVNRVWLEIRMWSMSPSTHSTVLHENPEKSLRKTRNNLPCTQGSYKNMLT